MMASEEKQNESKAAAGEPKKGRNREPLDIQIKLSDNRVMAVCEELPEGYQYSFSLGYEGEEQVRLRYSKETAAYFWLTKPGDYDVKVFAISDTGPRREGCTKTVHFEGKKLIVQNREKKVTVSESVSRLVRDLWNNREQTVRLAYFDYKARNKDSKMGKLWDILHPLIQILIFWFVFGVGFRSGKPVDGHPYLLWMLCGLTPWFFVSSGISSGCSAIFSKANVVLRMRYPVVTLPFTAMIESFIEHMMTMGILLIVEFAYGYFPKLQWLNLLYYQFYMIFLLSAFALITSTLTMIARDYQKLILSLIRLLFYLTPILWSIDLLPEEARIFLRLNPVLYIVDGYRDSLLYGGCFWQRPWEMLFFWIFAVGLMILGAWTHYRNRFRFSDLL